MMYRFNNQGFTLIELLIVLVLVGLSTSFVLPNMWKQFDQAKFYSERKQLISVAKFAKEYSIYRGSEIVFKGSGHELNVYQLKPGETITELNDEISATEERQSRREPLKQLTFSSFSIQPIELIFNGYGYFEKKIIEIQSESKGVEKVEI